MRNLILKHSKKFSTFIFTLTSVQLKFHPFPVWEVVDMNRRWWLSFHPFMRTRIVLQTQRAGSSFCFYTLWQFKWEHLLAESNRTGTISLTFQLRQQQKSRIEMKTSLFFLSFIVSSVVNRECEQRTNGESSADSQYYLEEGLSQSCVQSVQQIKRKLKLWKTRTICFAFSN